MRCPAAAAGRRSRRRRCSAQAVLSTVNPRPGIRIVVSWRWPRVGAQAAMARRRHGKGGAGRNDGRRGDGVATVRCCAVANRRDSRVRACGGHSEVGVPRRHCFEWRVVLRPAVHGRGWGGWVCRGGRAGGGEASGHEGRWWGGHRRRLCLGGAVGHVQVHALTMPILALGRFPHPRAQKAKPTVSLGAKFEILPLCRSEFWLVCNLCRTKISTNTSGQKRKIDRKSVV